MSGSKVNAAGGIKVKGQSSRGGQGQRSIQLGGSGQRSIQLGACVRSSWGGSGPAGGGQVQPAGGGVSILHPLVGGMPLAFTQEDFLVYLTVSVGYFN